MAQDLELVEKSNWNFNWNVIFRLSSFLSPQLLSSFVLRGQKTTTEGSGVENGGWP